MTTWLRKQQANRNDRHKKGHRWMAYEEGIIVDVGSATRSESVLLLLFANNYDCLTEMAVI
ncbi:hypothetical protein ACGRPS_10555 [Vibrio furnissii]|uniref:hypothetical protein n=1 Tax=Vibrio furnissii TaxID=29494 RepID=UPI0037492AB7